MRALNRTPGPLAALGKVLVVWALLQQSHLGVGGSTSPLPRPFDAHDASRFSFPPTAPSLLSDDVVEPSSPRAVVKRSTDDQAAYLPYDPLVPWPKRDDGYDSYMQSINYDPYMAWGKRPKRDDGYDSYMQTIGYDPYMAWGKRPKRDDGFDSYMQSIGYDPYSAWGKRPAKRSSKTSSGSYQREGAVERGAGRSMEEYGTYYPQTASTHYYEGDAVKKHDPYMDVYLPSHFMHSFKRSINPYYFSLASNDWKRAPNDMGAQGFHEGIFTHNFGDFSPVKRGKRDVSQQQEDEDQEAAPEKRRMGMGASGFHGDTFSQGFGDFDTMKKRRMGMGGASGFHGDTFSQGFGDFDTMKKRRMGMGGASGFHGDTFSQGFGDFDTMKKRRMGMGASGFHGDTFSQGFGDFDTMKKRRMGMGASGFHGDTFSQGFGDFDTMKKRRMGMGASGFHGDTFSHGFGDFDTMKKRRMGMGASGFHGDTFSQGFGDFDTMKKRRMGMGASGFHGDTFSQGFGDFDTMKKRRMGMGASGFHGDTFSQGFGDFDTMKKRSDYEGEGKEAAQEEKQEGVGPVDGAGEPGSRRKREADDSDGDDTLADTYDDPSAPYDQRYLMRQDEEEDEEEEEDQEDEQEVEEEARAKRNLEHGGRLQVELRPPVMTPVNTRRKRSLQNQDTDLHHSDGTQDDATRPLYKRSVDWGTSDGLGGFSTMKRRR